MALAKICFNFPDSRKLRKNTFESGDTVFKKVSAPAKWRTGLIVHYLKSYSLTEANAFSHASTL